MSNKGNGVICPYRGGQPKAPEIIGFPSTAASILVFSLAATPRRGKAVFGAPLSRAWGDQGLPAGVLSLQISPPFLCTSLLPRELALTEKRNHLSRSGLFKPIDVADCTSSRTVCGVAISDVVREEQSICTAIVLCSEQCLRCIS